MQKSLSKYLKIMSVAAMAATGMTYSTNANAFALPEGTCGVDGVCLTFDDFDVYSLALLNYALFDTTNLTGSVLEVRSSGTFIDDTLVVASSPANATGNQDLALAGGSTDGTNTQVDNAYVTPTNEPQAPAVNYLMTARDGGSGDHADGGVDNPDVEVTNGQTKTFAFVEGFDGDNIAQFQTTIENGATAPAGDGDNPDPIPDQSLPLWDITIDALNDYLDGGQLAFFFNLNEENRDNTDLVNLSPAENLVASLDSGQDMLAYADIYLHRTGCGTTTVAGADNDVAKGTQAGCFDVFTFSGAGGLPGQGLTQNFANGVLNSIIEDDILPEANDVWGFVHGQICVANGDGVPSRGDLLHFGACTNADANSQTLNQNLGAQQAAFALVSAALNAAIATGLYDVMSIDLRMAHIGNGYEQLFILPVDFRVNIPEPGTFAIFGFGLAGLGLIRRRKRRAA